MRKLLLSGALGTVLLLALSTGGADAPRGKETREAERHGRDRRARAAEEGAVWPAALGTPRELVPVPDAGAGGASATRRLGALVSPDRMLADLGRLTRIGEAGLFRTSGTAGEREAFAWLAGRVAELSWLARIGAAVERPRFRVPLASEAWRAELSVTAGGVETEVVAHALQGHRDNLALALRFDSDGFANDARPDPVVARGAVRVLRRLSDVSSLAEGALAGTVAFVDFALVDRGVVTSAAAAEAAAAVLRLRPEAVVLVTRYANVRGEAHGSFAGDVSAFALVSEPAPVPTITVKIEDLAPAGVRTLDDLDRLESARVAWDADVVSPGASEMLLLRVPGHDPTRALVVGAHLDSPNSPGALDDGSGAVALLEAARVLDEAGARPPVDTVFAWFGSHERGLYGSSVFVNANAPLLSRAVAMVQLDCLTHPLDGMTGSWVSEAQSYRAFGDARIPLPNALAGLAARAGLAVYPWEISGAASDNSSFDGFDVPSANTILLDASMTEVHVDGHLHDPYDDLPLAELHRKDLADLARIALEAVTGLPQSFASLRATPAKSGRAVFVASHTEAAHMTLAQQAAFGQALAWEGWAVDVVPYGTPVTRAALEGAGLVVVLPVADYPAPSAEPVPYDESFSADEAAALAEWARGGGLLVLAGSGSLLRYGTTPFAVNEDALDLNAVGEALGVVFEDRRLSGTFASNASAHALTTAIGGLVLAQGNGLAVRPGAGRVLCRSGSDAALVLFAAGARGEVLALGDASVLGGRGSAANLGFFRNLARYARTRTAP